MEVLKSISTHDLLNKKGEFQSEIIQTKKARQGGELHPFPTPALSGSGNWV